MHESEGCTMRHVQLNTQLRWIDLSWCNKNDAFHIAIPLTWWNSSTSSENGFWNSLYLRSCLRCYLNRSLLATFPHQEVLLWNSLMINVRESMWNFNTILLGVLLFKMWYLFMRQLCPSSMHNRGVASLRVPGGQNFHFPHFPLKFRLMFLFSWNLFHFLPHFGPTPLLHNM